MIWGMTLEPGKLYTEIMGEEVQLSMAAIDSRKDLDDSSKSFCQIVMKTSKGEYVLCTLVHGVMFQQNLDLKLMPREKVTFSVQGPSVVYLVGYTASYPEDEEDLDLEDEEDIEAAENSSAWESFDAEEESLMEQIKEEPLEIPDDMVETETEETTELDVYKGGEEELPSIPQTQEQPGQQQTTTTSEMENTQEEREEREEEIIFSVAELETGEMKTEAPTPKPASPPPSPPMQQMPPPQDMYNIQTKNAGTALGEPGPNSDFFYPETQQQPEVPITPPVSFQPSNSAPEYQQQNPQGLLPTTDSFIPPQQKTYVQRAPQPIQHRPIVRGTVQQMNTQRTYPPQRRQYGTNRNQPAGKTRSLPQPINVQQVRNISNIQQQSIPGTSQQDMPGPSTSGMHLRSKGMWNQSVPIHQAPHHPSTQQLPSSIQQTFQKGTQNLSSSGADSPLYACSYCGKTFGTIHKWKVHVRFHQLQGRFSCRFCPRTFARSGDLTRHERIHTGEKPFQCSYCPKAFSRMATVREHEMIHTGQRPFQCKVCGKRFRKKRVMTYHEKNKH